MNKIINLIVFILIGKIGFNAADFPKHSHQHVQPFKVLIVWHSSSKQSFLLQKDLLLRLNLELIKYSDVVMTPLSASHNESIYITKTDQKWITVFANLLFDTGKVHDNVIESNVITNAITEHLNHTKTTKIAEELFLVVDDASMLDNVTEAASALKVKKTYVLFATEKEIQKPWQDLATDENHLFKLTGNENSSENKLIELAYNDSRLYCDTDYFWDGNRCLECTYICSMKTKTVSSDCKRDCPYLDRKQTKPSTDGVDMQPDVETAISDQKGLILVLIIISIVIVLAILVFLFWFFCIRNRNQRQSDEEAVQNGNALPRIDADTDRHPIMETEHREPSHMDNSEDGGSERDSFLGYTGPPHEASHSDLPGSHEGSTHHEESSSISQDGNCSMESLDTPEERGPSKLSFAIEFKGDNEVDANGHTFGGPPLVKLHTDGQTEDATYVKEISQDMV